MTGPVPGRRRPDVAVVPCPERVRRRLGAAAPDALACLGDPALLDRPLLALFSAVRLPPRLALRALDLVRRLRHRGAGVVGGFHAPLEREALALLLRGAGPVVVCPARGLERIRLPAAWRPPLEDGRLLVVSGFPGGPRRPTGKTAEARNRLVAGLSERVLVVHAQRGGRAYRLAAEALTLGATVLTFDDPANAGLVLLGARPLDETGPDV